MIRRISALAVVLVIAGASQVQISRASDPTADPTPTPSLLPGGKGEASAPLTASVLPQGRTLIFDYGASGYRYKVVSQGAISGFEAVLYDDVAGGFATGTSAFADDPTARTLADGRTAAPAPR